LTKALNTADGNYICDQKDNHIFELEKQLQEALHKQHEAMTKVVQLADRNHTLESKIYKFPTRQGEILRRHLFATSNTENVA